MIVALLITLNFVDLPRFGNKAIHDGIGPCNLLLLKLIRSICEVDEKSMYNKLIE